MLRYTPGVDKDLDDMQRELETIANLTQGAEDTVVYMKDSATSAQKSSSPGITLSLVPLNLFLRPIFIQLYLSPFINMTR